MSTLYQITGKHYELLNSIDDFENLTPEQVEELTKEIELTEQDFYNKSENYVKYINSLESENLIIENEIKRLTKLKKSNENKVKFLKTNLLNGMEMMAKNKIDFPTFKLSIRNSKAVNINESDLIPEKFKNEVTEIKIDKKLIKTALENGENIPGASMEIRKNINIR